MAKKTQLTDKKSTSKKIELEVVIPLVKSEGVIEHEITIEKTQKLSLSEELLTKIDNKLETLITLGQSKNQTKINEMTLTDLNFLKELLNRNIVMNNYPGGDNQLKVASNNLIVKINDEVNNRINLYQ